MSAVDFTVAICTYNGEKRLPEVLDRLRVQTFPESLQWEILVIDNNSTDHTAGVVKEYQANWPEAYPLRYCFEPRQGQGYARQQALSISESEWVGFLDDDNLPEPGWVAAAYQFGQAYPNAGAYGSQVHGLFEVTPPPELEWLLPFLAIVERGDKPLQYLPAKKLLPPGAGLVIRRQAYLESVPEKSLLVGRTSGSMLAGEDLELLCHLWLKGWEIWYNPEMQIHHKIPKQRLQPNYLLPFFQGIGLSRYVTRMLSVKPWQRPLFLVMYFLNDLRKIIFYLLKYRTQIRHDLTAACKLQLSWASLISPFYIWQLIYFKQAGKKT